MYQACSKLRNQAKFEFNLNLIQIVQLDDGPGFMFFHMANFAKCIHYISINYILIIYANIRGIMQIHDDPEKQLMS